MAHLLDEEILETLTYERSRTWSNFIKTCEENDYGVDIPLNKLEEVYEDQHEEGLDEMEEAEEEDVEDDIKNTTMSMSKAELTLMLSSGDNKEILNQTLPIVEEHVRKWKEAGLDRILNTFDAQKIEQHVGDWLRRHNSAYGDKNVVKASPSKSCHRRHKTKSGIDLYIPVETDDSEAESMHSIDTARYIRESRKCKVPTTSKCNSPMMTIKTYRTVPRKRAELRAKYGCDELNEEKEHHHMQALLHRRDQLHGRKRDRERQLRYHSMHNPYNHELSLNGLHRRKHLRKRRDVSIMYSSSSSSEDDRRHDRCDCSPCLRRSISQTIHPYYAYRSYQSHSHSYRDYHHQRLESGPRSIHSTLNFKRSVCKLRRQQCFDEEIRPRLLESECKCCNSDRLCSNVVHNTNSSKEELFFQSESIPNHMIQTPRTHLTSAIKCCSKSQQNQREKKTKDNSSSEEEGINDTIKDVKPVLSISKKLFEIEKKTTTTSAKFATAEKTSPKKQVRRQKQTPKADPISPNRSLSKADIPSSLSPGIEEAIKTTSAVDVVGATKDNLKVIRQKKASTGKTMSKKKNKEHDKIVDKIETSTKRKKKPDDEKELKKAMELSMKTYKQEQEKLKQQKDTANITSKASTSLQLPEKSTFSNQSVACNSTAVFNQTSSALAQNSTQTMAPVNAIIELSSSDSSISEQPRRKSKINVEGDVDCTMVTSTTGCEASAGQSDATLVAKRPDIKITKKGILLYAPKQVTGGKQDQSTNSYHDNFMLTEQSLSPIIGERRARKFLKYHTGSRSFDSRYSVYYRPTPKMVAMLSADSKSLDLDSPSSSGSDVDIFEQVDRYGVIYPVLEKLNESD